nr:replication protein A 70 kDa DNA-binding subunit D-like [Ipomoea batatas]
MPSQYVSAHELSPLHTRRAMRLRLVRTYEVPEKRGGNLMRSKECLFHDDKGTYIHANISKEEVEKYCKVLKEGNVYSIKNFLVVTNYYKYKTTTHKYLIKFNYNTVVKESKSRQFPTHMLRIKSFESLRNPVEVNETELFGNYVFFIYFIYSVLP